MYIEIQMIIPAKNLIFTLKIYDIMHKYINKLYKSYLECGYRISINSL